MLPTIWVQIEGYIREAFESEDYREIDLLMFFDRIASGHMQLWVLTEGTEIVGALMTELHSFMGEKICHIPVVGGGSIEEWEKFLTEVIEPWCQEREVDRIEFMTHKAASRILTRHDYYVSKVKLTKRLTRGEING